MGQLVILIPVAVLLIAGVAIALRSGLDPEPGRPETLIHRLGGTVTALFLRVIGYLAGIAALQHAIGMPSLVSW